MAERKNMNRNLATTWSREDRDLLIEVKTHVGGLREDIQSLTNTVKETTQDHETRLRTLEAQSNKWLGKESLVGGAVGIIASFAMTLLK